MRLLTLVAIAFAAYGFADIAHETLGHGGACLLSGGRSLLVDTTFQDCSLRSRWIDGAGPAMGIAVALSAWLGARRVRGENLRIFLVLVFAFAAFWNVGYLIKSGLSRTGDWHFLIEGLEPSGAWHIGLAVAGVVLYIAAMRMLARAWPTGEGMRSGAFSLIAYGAAAVLAAAAACFDPRGTQTILSDALPSSLGAIGLPLVGLRRSGDVAVQPSTIWVAAGLASAAAFVAMLGPGLRF
jgi:hypothetical protein